MSSPTVSVDEVETRTERKSVSFLRNSKYIYMCVCVYTEYICIPRTQIDEERNNEKKKKTQKIKIL